MSDCCARSLNSRFDSARAERELRVYRRKGADRETRLLVDALLAAGVDGATVLDIGGGIGAIPDALLGGGAAHAVSVEASAGFIKAAEALAQEKGYRDRIECRRGDFVDVAEAISPADVVTLDKVICCYPDMRALVARSADRAGRLYGAVYPVNDPPVRAINRLWNLLRRLVGSEFRTYVHRESAIEALLAEHGLRPRSRTRTAVWRIVVFERAAAPA